MSRIGQYDGISPAAQRELAADIRRAQSAGSSASLVGSTAFITLASVAANQELDPSSELRKLPIPAKGYLDRLYVTLLPTSGTTSLLSFRHLPTVRALTLRANTTFQVTVNSAAATTFPDSRFFDSAARVIAAGGGASYYWFPATPENSGAGWYVT